MKIIIVGLGKVGYAIAQQMVGEEHDLILVDESAAVIEHADATLDAMCVEGNGACASVLLRAGVRDADLVIAATADDEVNLVCSLMAKKLGAKHTVARVRNPEYFRDAPILRREIGLDMIINPEYAAAQEIARILRVPAAFSVESFARGTVELIGFQITEQDGMAGKSLIEYNKLHPNALLLCAAKRGGEVLVPNGHFVPQAGDRVYAIGTPTETARVLRSMGRDTSPIRQLSVIGGGRIALYLAWALDGMGMHITIVEQNEEKCMAIAEKLPKATILHGDGTDHDLLESEGIFDADAFVSLTGRDEENLLMALTAKDSGVAKVLPKMSRPNYTALVQAIQEAYPYTDIIVNTVPPIPENHSNYPHMDQAKIDDFNMALLNMCEQLGVKFLNTAEVLKGENGYGQPDYYTDGDIHLKSAGLKAALNYLRTHAYQTEDRRPDTNNIPTRTLEYVSNPSSAVQAPSSEEPASSSESESVSSSETASVKFEARYQVEKSGGGTLSCGNESGKTSLTYGITDASQSLTVTATPAEGHVFVKWSDGVTSKTRTDTGFKQNLDVTAVFAAVSVHISEGKASAGSYVFKAALEGKYAKSENLHWFANGQEVKEAAGQTTVTVSASAITSGSYKVYAVVVYNDCAVVSNALTITVSPEPASSSNSGSSSTSSGSTSASSSESGKSESSSSSSSHSTAESESKSESKSESTSSSHSSSESKAESTSSSSSTASESKTESKEQTNSESVSASVENDIEPAEEPSASTEAEASR